MTLAAQSWTAWVHAADLARSACGGGGAMGVVDDDREGRERHRRRRGARRGRRRRKRRRAWDVMVVTGVRMSLISHKNGTRNGAKLVLTCITYYRTMRFASRLHYPVTDPPEPHTQPLPTLYTGTTSSTIEGGYALWGFLTPRSVKSPTVHPHPTSFLVVLYLTCVFFFYRELEIILAHIASFHHGTH